ncbi:MAG: hypothetical protein K2W82_09970 [Candidatus Obscuribacterales bacterium]|nr:hypothetical protein [Candidatus Obscuribacterales bacterium]
MNYRAQSKILAGMPTFSILLMALIALMLFSRADAAPGDLASGDSSSSATLKGTVVEVGTALNNLRDARLSIGRVRKATANLYDEVTRQQVSMNSSPNVVGTMVIMTSTPRFSGQFLPARKKWINASMAEIGPIINLFKEDVDAAIESDRQADVSAATHEALSPLQNDAFETVKISFGLYKQLESLTSGPLYDNGAIATEVKKLDNQMKQLDRSLKKGISILQKDAKKSKHS